MPRVLKSYPSHSHATRLRLILAADRVRKDDAERLAMLEQRKTDTTVSSAPGMPLTTVMMLACLICPFPRVNMKPFITVPSHVHLRVQAGLEADRRRLDELRTQHKAAPDSLRDRHTRDRGR